MIQADRGHARLALWLASTSLLIVTLYSGQLILLTGGLDTLLTSTLGTVFPAYPFLALLVLLTGLRWRDFHRVLLTERGLTSMPTVRLAGLALIVVPAALWYTFFAGASQSDYLALEAAASSLVLVAYGALLLTNPGMWRIMLPYASLYAAGLVAPLFMIDTLGAPLALFSSNVAAAMTQALGLHVAWQGVSFAFLSSVGEPISSVVTPACSAVYSISIYLALLGLMYLDMPSSLGNTLKFAVVGVALIPLLDSARIAIMIWFGYVGGSTAFWGVHDWLGYGIFLAFYVGVLLAYSRTVRRGPVTSFPSLALPT
ncbi:MAG: exosortase/archaeosortase family protein [Thaumarchaeota archaeon]|nr:exosortase/archaeosortase family protein [Nitrososphaerota archaeon]